MRTILPFLMCVLCLTSLYAQQTSISIYYDTDQSILALVNRQKIDSMMASYSGREISVKLSAYADSMGSEAYNKRLASKRLRNVFEYLSVNPRISIADSVNFGESISSRVIENENDLRFYRRVDIEVLDTAINSIVADAENSRFDKYYFFTSGENPCQKVHVRLDRRRKIVGKKGTTIIIYPKDIETIDGKTYRGEAIISLCEYFDYGSMMLAGLGTQTSSSILETGGMIFVDMETTDGEKLEISRGQAIHVGLPTDSLRENMNLYLLNDRKKASGRWTRINDHESLLFQESMDKKKLRGRSGKVFETMVVATYDPDNYRSVLQYQFNLKKFGLINCDRELEFPETRTVEISISNNRTSNVHAFLLLTNYASILHGRYSDGKIMVEGVPLSEEANVIVIEEDPAGGLRSGQLSLTENNRYDLALETPTSSWDVAR